MRGAGGYPTAGSRETISTAGAEEQHHAGRAWQRAVWKREVTIAAKQRVLSRAQMRLSSVFLHLRFSVTCQAAKEHGLEWQPSRCYLSNLALLTELLQQEGAAEGLPDRIRDRSQVRQVSKIAEAKR